MGRSKHKSGTQGTQGTPQNKQPAKRPRASSGATDDDPDALIDIVLGALADKETMERFIKSLCTIPDIKNQLIQHLVPSLDEQVKEILTPLKKSVDDLETKLKASHTQYKDLEAKHDDLEQYTRRQNVRISGIAEQDGEDTDDLIINFAKNALKVDLDPAAIDRSHRVGRKSPTKPTRDIIVRFVSYKTKTAFMKSRKAARLYNNEHSTRHFISEDLTRKRSNLAFEARKHKRQGTIKDTWTFDGKVFVKRLNDSVSVCRDIDELSSLTA